MLPGEVRILWHAPVQALLTNCYMFFPKMVWSRRWVDSEDLRKIMWRASKQASLGSMNFKPLREGANKQTIVLEWERERKRWGEGERQGVRKRQREKVLEVHIEFPERRYVVS